MTKKHFIAIAAGFKSRVVELNDNENLSFEAREAVRVSLNDCARMFCAVASADNAAFDRARFLTACGF